MTEHYSLADPAVATFVWIPLLLAGLLITGAAIAWRRSGASASAAARAAAGVGIAAGAWLAITWQLSIAGVFQHWDRVPPPFLLLLIAIVALSLILSFSAVGTRIARTIPVWVLVAVQGFRLPLELAMHAMATRGIMPGQMTYTGRNFDIVTGASALLVAGALLIGRGGRRLVVLWNILGLALLGNIVAVALLSTPVFRAFGDDRLNLFIAYTPFVWLPSAMVLAALAGHVIVFRALRAQTPSS